MSNKIKFEPSNHTIQIKQELIDQEADNGVLSEVKQEPEMVIEFDATWLPTKLEDEQQEYYELYQQQQNENHEDECRFVLSTIKPDKEEGEQYSIKYIDSNDEDNTEDAGDNMSDKDYIEDDSRDHDSDYTASGDDDDDNNDDIYDNDSDTDSENFKIDVLGNNYMKLAQSQEEYHKMQETSGDSKKDDVANNIKLYHQRSFWKWLRSYMQYVCPICQNKFKSDSLLASHINKQHKDSIGNAKLNFYMNATQAICKQCSKVFRNDVILLLHSMRHSAQNSIEVFMCNICQFKTGEKVFIQRHIVEEHTELIELFKNFKIKSNEEESHECPVCLAVYDNHNGIRYHFIDAHPKEYWNTFAYPCQLCEINTNRFDTAEEYYEHLLEEHNLKDWSLMNFKIFSNNSKEEYFYCTKCFKIFTEMNLAKFVRHYLEHDSNSFLSCRSCLRKLSYRKENIYHMCNKLFNKLRTRTEKTKGKTSSSSSCSKKDMIDASNIREFEEYIKHVCPFCNKEFEKFQNWQMHLRKTHHLDSLKGLKMKQIVGDSNKLQCTICYIFINNKSVELHTHRFQHLPYKPYKCRHCLLSLNNLKTTLSHILNKCQDPSKELAEEKALAAESYEIKCPLCNNLKFSSYHEVLLHYSDTHDNFINYFSKNKDNSMVCNVCQSQLPKDEHRYRSHVLKHFDQKTLKCLKCSQFFNNQATYRRHARFHGVTPINKEEKDAENTLKIFHRPKKFSVDLKTPPQHQIKEKSILNEFIEFINYACPECNESLTTHQLWLDHIKSKHDCFHEQQLGIKNPLDGSIKCLHCPLKLTSAITQRQKHKLTHMPYKSFICNLCYYRATSTGVLYGHLRRVHFLKGTHKCPICSEVCSTNYERTEHIKQAHARSEWPDNMCLVCYKTMLLGSLKEHMNTHDINRPKMECKYCGVKIISLRDFNIHVATKHENAQDKEKSEIPDKMVKSIQNNKINNSSNNSKDTGNNKETDTPPGEDKTNLPKKISTKRKSNSKASNSKKKTKTVRKAKA